jgi:hypothetical protein
VENIAMNAIASNPRERIGGNNPPGAIDFAKESAAALSDWMKDHPVIETDDDARAAKMLVDRAKSSLESMETERDGLVRPLNTQAKAINDKYRQPRTLLERVRNALADRLTAYAKRLEAERYAKPRKPARSLRPRPKPLCRPNGTPKRPRTTRKPTRHYPAAACWRAFRPWPLLECLPSQPR